MNGFPTLCHASLIISQFIIFIIIYSLQISFPSIVNSLFSIAILTLTLQLNSLCGNIFGILVCSKCKVTANYNIIKRWICMVEYNLYWKWNCTNHWRYFKIAEVWRDLIFLDLPCDNNAIKSTHTKIDIINSAMSSEGNSISKWSVKNNTRRIQYGTQMKYLCFWEENKISHTVMITTRMRFYIKVCGNKHNYIEEWRYRVVLKDKEKKMTLN